MKRFVSVLIILSMSLALITGCGSSEKETASEGNYEVDMEKASETTLGLAPFKERQKLRIGFFTGSPLSYPFLFADKLGYFDELNIDIEYVPFTNGPAMMEANNDWDIGGVGLGGLTNAMKGYDLRIIDITDYEENLALFVRPDHPLAEDPKDPENWKGTEWIYPAGTTAQAVLVNALEEVGLDMSDIESINMDVANALTGFQGGTGDGLGVWNVIAFEAEDTGFVRIGDAGTLGFTAPCGTVVSEKTLEAKRPLIETAIAVFHLTTEWIYESDENMEQAVAWFLEDGENEGIRINQSIAERVMEWYRGPTTGEFIEIFTNEAPDEAGIYTKRDLIQAERDILVGVDFFISQGNYTEEDREKFLDDGLIDPSVAIGVKEMLDELQIEY
ncbi:MAG TPA: ABC transporter substrate-binding protein [Tepidimicrobium sp.]|nr:ABC transporter substrate-binding protein [Tepidimicrobium sp.]